MHPAAAVRIIGAAAGARVKELAGDVGEVNFAALLVFKLDKAAAAASVAETFPFRRCECFERFSLPKWYFVRTLCRALRVCREVFSARCGEFAARRWRRHQVCLSGDQSGQLPLRFAMAIVKEDGWSNFRRGRRSTAGYAPWFPAMPATRASDRPARRPPSALESDAVRREKRAARRRTASCRAAG